MDTVRIGVIGIGNMGGAHAACISAGEIKGLTLTAVCDTDADKLSAFSAAHPQVQTFADYGTLLRSGAADAVIIAVPHPLHGEIAVAAFAHGLHVLTEKPADIAVSRALRMNEAARRSGKVFAIMFNQRTNPLFRRAREIVAGGLLGELKRSVWIITNWYRTDSYYRSAGWRATWSGEGGGVLLNQAPHNLDLWQWICGMPASVTAFCDIGKYHEIEVEDDATIVTRYENGAVGTFITTTGEYPGTNRLEISGTLGKIVLENGSLKWWRLREDERDVRRGSEKGFAKIPADFEEIFPDEPESAHRGILRNFADAILHGAPLIAPGEEGIRSLTLSNAAYLSAAKGSTAVSLPFDCAEFDALLQNLSANSGGHTVPSASVHTTGYNERWNVRW